MSEPIERGPDALPQRLARTCHLLVVGLWLGLMVGVLVGVMVTFAVRLEGLTGQDRQAERIQAGGVTGKIFTVSDRIGYVLAAMAWATGLWSWQSSRRGRAGLALRVILLVVLTASLLTLGLYMTPKINGLQADAAADGATAAAVQAACEHIDRLHPQASRLWYVNLLALLALFMVEGLSGPRRARSAS